MLSAKSKKFKTSHKHFRLLSMHLLQPDATSIKICVIIQKRSNFCLPKVTSFFIQAAGLAYHHRAKCGAYHQPLWGCISSRISVHLPAAWWDTTLRVGDIQCFALMICNGKPLIYFLKYGIMRLKGVVYMAKNYLLTYAEQLATDVELLCQNIKVPFNTLFQIRKSSSSVYANIREANYGQSKADMLSKL